LSEHWEISGGKIPKSSISWHGSFGQPKEGSRCSEKGLVSWPALNVNPTSKGLVLDMRKYLVLQVVGKWHEFERLVKHAVFGTFARVLSLADRLITLQLFLGKSELDNL
jgi:hypothetical protein